ncbi:MAG: glutamyl-tRNA reductase [Thermoanaerobaculia bacterium]|nr:glutamyl-tRNA reductase [Thermoanaerobaculia bacterium]
MSEPSPGLGSDETGLLVVGVDFHSAELELREQVALSGHEAESALLEIMAHPEIAEAALLSTCNRTEVYLSARERQKAFRVALDLFARNAPEIDEEGCFFVLHDREAARRLLSVAAGLESMVLGEPEILGQVRDAAALAEKVGSSGPILDRLFRQAATAGKRSRRETGIGEGAISLGYASVELSRQIFDELESRSLLIVGAGETADLVARALHDRGNDRIRFVNRSDERAEAFQERFPIAERVPWDDLVEAVTESDTVVTTTSAPEPILDLPTLKTVMRARRARPLLLVDLGVPRNVDGAAAGLENLFLHDLDSLQSLVDRNLDRRRQEIPRVEGIVTEELQRFDEWQRAREAQPLVARLHRRAEEIRRQEVASVQDRFPSELHEELEIVTRALVRKILHHPSHQLRRGSREGGRARLDLARQLFQLEEEESAEEQES